MYSQEITRRHRAAIVIAIDQSCSMSGRMILKGWELSKSEAVSIVVGELVDELIMRTRRDGNYRYYYDVALIGYSGDEVYSLFGDELMFSSRVRVMRYGPQSLPNHQVSSGIYNFWITLKSQMQSFCKNFPILAYLYVA